ncbi:MAG: hypothetical protein ABF434_08425, partial [Liquorilactobacillus nagelii]
DSLFNRIFIHLHKLFYTLMVYVSRYLGHASVMITEKYYIGLLPEQVEVEAGKVLKVIEG